MFHFLQKYYNVVIHVALTTSINNQTACLEIYSTIAIKNTRSLFYSTTDGQFLSINMAETNKE
jgi:hypothetical protein